ncbi:MAG TPA: hypothetical protein VD994_01600 [Prosthecobacter sp.]|nr:hypothetical protein [Prosthecobacter sp.]
MMGFHMGAIFSIHLAVTWLLTGLIWMIQLLVYPQFLRVGAQEFARYHWAHCVRIGLIVAPLLAIEAATAGWLLLQGQRGLPFVLSLALIPAVWLSTALFQAPLHTKLMRGLRTDVVRRLMLTNWMRTLAWTARGVLLSCTIQG